MNDHDIHWSADRDVNAGHIVGVNANGQIRLRFYREDDLDNTELYPDGSRHDVYCHPRAVEYNVHQDHILRIIG